MFLHSKHSGLCSIGMCINFASRSRAGAEEFVEFDSTIWTITWFMHFFGSSPLLLISLENLWTSISRSYGLWTLQLEQETWPAFDYPFDFLQANAQGTQISMPASVYFGWTMFKLLFHETASVIGTSILLPCKTSLWDEDNSSAMMFHFCNAGRTLYAFLLHYRPRVQFRFLRERYSLFSLSWTAVASLMTTNWWVYYWEHCGLDS